jgi:hypothetical protein
LAPEVLIAILDLVSPLGTREDLYTLLSLTQVCRDWRILLIGHPRAWTTIFATHRDSRRFVEVCLERSQDQPLEVTVDINDKFWAPTGCSCNNDGYGKLLPNEESPCEWHFSFELLAQPSVSDRIDVLRVSSSSQVLPPPRISESQFEKSWTHFPQWLTHPSISELGIHSNHSWSPVLDLQQCRFFRSTFQQLTTLVWDDEATNYARILFSAPSPFPELKSTTFKGYWHRSLSLTQVHNLTSFTIKRYLYTLNAEELRTFLLNNQSLISLEIFISIRGQTEGDPVVLSNLKSLSIDCNPTALSTILQIPASQRFSTLLISLEHGRDDLYSLRATEEQVSLFAGARGPKVQEEVQRLTGYPGSTVPHPDVVPSHDSRAETTTLMADAHTVDVRLTYSGVLDDRLWDKLKLLGELKVIRFEVLGERNKESRGPGEEFTKLLDPLWDRITDLMEHRFRNGRPLHAVEAMVINKSGNAGRLQDVLWNSPFENRDVQKYLATGQL